MKVPRMDYLKGSDVYVELSSHKRGAKRVCLSFCTVQQGHTHSVSEVGAEGHGSWPCIEAFLVPCLTRVTGGRHLIPCGRIFSAKLFC